VLYEAFVQQNSTKWHPLLHRGVVAVLLALALVYSILEALFYGTQVNAWWENESLLLCIAGLHLLAALITGLISFSEDWHYVKIAEQPGMPQERPSSGPGAPAAQPSTHTVQKWDPRTQLFRVVRIGLYSTIMTISAQAALHWIVDSVQLGKLTFDWRLLLYVVFAFLSFPSILFYRRECYRRDFYFGMLAMVQLFTLCSVAIVDRIFVHEPRGVDFILPLIVLVLFVLPLAFTREHAAC
jgi:hypothetical protein